MNVLLVEDDPRILSFLQRGLEAEGFSVATATDGLSALEAIRANGIDLVILDRMLPRMDGLTLCRTVRQEARPVLILMLTAKDSLPDKIEGLQGGADDYLTKPFSFDELLARIGALKRRAPVWEASGRLAVGPVEIDETSHRVTMNGEDVSLTPREYELLRFLMANAGKVVSRQRLLSSVWNYGFDPGTKVVDVYIRYLRAKLGDHDGHLIRTVRGVGYRLAAPGA
ncbi:response regulator transcription factor [Aureimonas populi]|uniref:Response regulator transcription factor n=1 Tax=Aureimonas populi TaxID=1701758 RepID=A0ABW5CI88_9HYPH|nr:response regulator transcription factor [Aureimonas populi]